MRITKAMLQERTIWSRDQLRERVPGAAVMCYKLPGGYRVAIKGWAQEDGLTAREAFHFLGGIINGAAITDDALLKALERKERE